MSWMNLDQPHKVAIIGLCMLGVAILSAVSFYLENPFWIIGCHIAIIAFSVYGFFLFLLFMHDFIELQTWKKYQLEYNELLEKEKELMKKK